MSATGPRVIVTAGASGIGEVVARSFLSQGARVHICDVDEAALTATLAAEPRLVGRKADVANEAEIGAFVAGAIAAMGGVDVLVANAGVAGPTAPVEEIALEDWRRCVAVNLDGAFLTARAVIPSMKAQGKGGSIVLLSSTAGLFGFPRRAPYCASKWAIRGLTKTLAQELGPFGIRVNCICPGAVEGPRIDRVITAEAKKSGRPVEAVRKQYASQSALETFISPEDIAATIAFLASPGGARISGQEIAVDGYTKTL